jgi:protein-S-isoprenylcysteine O-methyltransferase Ste14
MSASTVHRLSDLVVAGCWVLVLLAWIAGAIYTARRGPGVERRSRANSLWIVCAALVWIVFRVVPNHDWNAVSTGVSAVRIAGLVVLVAFTAFTLWARVSLGTMWSTQTVTKSHHELRTGGPYAITRHPIYTGFVGMLLGTALAVGFGVWTMLFVLGLIVAEVKIHAEERLLGDVFPVAYAEYRRKVPQLVPGLRLGWIRRRV